MENDLKIETLSSIKLEISKEEIKEVGENKVEAKKVSEVIEVKEEVKEINKGLGRGRG